MVTLRLLGGLGNQLFIYALGRALEHRGQQVRFDTTLLDNQTERVYLLDRLGIELNLCKGTLGDTIVEGGLRFKPWILDVAEDHTLEGYWQSEKYLLEVQDQIRREMFKPPWMASEESNAVALKIGRHNLTSCFIHVRRTDNLRPAGLAIHGLTSAENALYYQRAILLMREKVPGVKFFAFSDDPDWIHKAFMRTPDVTVVDCNPMSGTYENGVLLKNDQGSEAEDLWLMSLCRHGITANSSFSWWAAWLNQNQNERVVIAPDPWFASKELDSTDIVPDRWTKVAVQ
jgi:hypothetical protein